MNGVKKVRGDRSSRTSNRGGGITSIPRGILKLFTIALFMGGFFGHSDLSGVDAFNSQLNLKPVQRIDALIEKRLREMGAEPNPVASQEVLLRRLYLQIIGRNPTVQEFEDYMGVSPSGKSSFAELGRKEKKRELIDKREFSMNNLGKGSPLTPIFAAN